MKLSNLEPGNNVVNILISSPSPRFPVADPELNFLVRIAATILSLLLATLSGALFFLFKASLGSILSSLFAFFIPVSIIGVTFALFLKCDILSIF